MVKGVIFEKCLSWKKKMGLSTEQTLYSLLLYEALYPTNHFSDNILVLLKQEKPTSPPKPPSVLKRSYYCYVINHGIRKRNWEKVHVCKNCYWKKVSKTKRFFRSCMSKLSQGNPNTILRIWKQWYETMIRKQWAQKFQYGNCSFCWRKHSSLLTMVERSNSLIFSELYTITWEALKKEKMSTKVPFFKCSKSFLA